MSIADSLRKGFRFFLMSMGVSTYPRRNLSQPELKADTKDAVPPVIPPTRPD